MSPAFVVPRGPEATAVRRGAGPGARVIATAAGTRAAHALPTLGGGTLVLALGLCGALRSRTVGDVVVYHQLAGDDPAQLLEPALAATLAAALPGAHAVRGCTADHVVTRRAERAAFATRFDADVVDMESAQLVRALRAQRVRFAIVRVVSDDAQRDLPALEGAIDAAGNLDVARLAGAFVRDPRGAFAFARDARRALAVLGRTAGALTAALG